MAIIDFTAGDALQTVLPDAGIYPAIAEKIDGPKASGSGKSISFFSVIRITEGKYIGKEFKPVFNSGTSENSMLGSMQYMPQSMLLQLEAAQNGTKVEPVARPGFDTDNLLNKPFCIQIAIQPNKEGGNLLAQIVAFLPQGADKVQSPFG